MAGTGTNTDRTVGAALAGRAGTYIVPDATAGKAATRTGARAAAGKAPAKDAGTKKPATRKNPTKGTRRDTGASGGADVIGITTPRRRAAAE